MSTEQAPVSPDALGQLRTALVYRADTYKRFADQLAGSTGNERSHMLYLRARSARVAHYECIKLLDELLATGKIRNFENGGADGLLDLATGS